MGGVPSVPTDPTRRVQVIAAGYSRTGTLSMQLALEELLGGPVLHGGTQILTREDVYCKKWVRAYAARRSGDGPALRGLLRQLTAGFVAVADMPPLDFVPELMAMYPEARVVLTTRDPDRWLESIRPVARGSSLWWLPYLLWPIPGWRWFPALSLEFGRSTKAILGRTGEQVRNPEPSTDLLLNWNKKVREMVPRSRLLVMDVREGWAPLCEFLDLPVPAATFPRANDARSAEETQRQIVRRVLHIWLLWVLGAVAAGLAVAWAACR